VASTARSGLEVPHRAHRVTRAEAAAPAPAPDPADRLATDLEVRADLHLPGRVDLADRAALDPMDRADPPWGRVDPADRAALVPTDPADPADRAVLVPTDPADPADRVARGTGTTSAATSMERRGETDPPPGARANHRRRRGTGRFRRPVERGTMARSTTGATTKLRSGIPNSTSGASTSSESGFRCNE
jgi:hypothetical protein